MYIYIYACILYISFRRNPDVADSLKAKGSVMGFGPWDALTLLRRWLPLVPSEGAAGVIGVVDSSGSYYKYTYIYIYVCKYIYRSYHMKYELAIPYIYDIPFGYVKIAIENGHLQ